MKIIVFVTTLIAFMTIAPNAYAQENTDVYDTLSNQPDLNTFVQLIDVAQMADKLHSDGPYTVWAPVDAAFENVSSERMDELINNPDELQQFITYHMAPTAISAAAIIQMPNVKTAQGRTVQITADEAGVHINNTTVVRPDIPASNGLIHVIDGVLLPLDMVELPNGGIFDNGDVATLLIIFGIMSFGLGLILIAQPSRSKSHNVLRV